ncbi:GtrA family protein [Oharaeibacter diazotrophicus]|uniref:Putative flippase GtrA n=1 Tax=Oharaeibacter diazotrophicus TaxID=1920512 RepID=A0A4V3CWL5_9HYPH|nr:GtrA family protein [Oharaeibacter diazotrophicus]TDP86818.1 putative flippase GtrA [Oharaeibacter diazotrophicus]BBE71239.1 GtrA-like protein [Pleomorphomonas sp. SM30]GLS77993.1 hypothetical protein GCM10007904_33300 [Oharaeibacter diazotrophicus]
MTDERRRFLLFLLTGGMAAGVNVLCRIAFGRFVSFEVAVPLAYLCGMTTAFVLARRFVFAHAGDGVHGQYARFALVNLIAAAQVWIVSVGLARWLFPALAVTWHADTLAHAVGVASPIVGSYLGHRHFSFRGADRSV